MPFGCKLDNPAFCVFDCRLYRLETSNEYSLSFFIEKGCYRIIGLHNGLKFMTFTLRHLALASLFALIPCQAVATSDNLAEPPMWVVSDADSEITLYPTVHILPPDLEWKSEKLLQRLSEAEEIWFEILPGSEADPELKSLMMRMGMAPGTSVTADLTADEISTLETAVAPLGIPLVVADEMRPWMVTTLAGMGALIEKGFDPNSGVEKQLVPLVEGKKMRALETAEAQIQMLASIPAETQMKMLRQTLNEMDDTVEVLRDLVTDWSVGDVQDLEEDLLDEMKTETPDVYEIVFTTRNKYWADQIELELKGAGTDFIAVGAGHLVGDEGVPAILKARGYSVKRL